MITSPDGSPRNHAGLVQQEIRIDRYETLRTGISDAERVRLSYILSVNAGTRSPNGCPIADIRSQPVLLTYLVVGVECPAACEEIQGLNGKDGVEATFNPLRVSGLEKDGHGWIDGPLTASNGSPHSRGRGRAS